jgi:CBASS immunity sensor of nucleotide second messenger signals
VTAANTTGAAQPSKKSKRWTKLRTVTRCVIWARGAGRCYFCNKELIGDYLMGLEDANFGFIAHIVAEIEGGPRGHPIDSPRLADDPTNLMLLCYIHHKMIDVDREADFPVENLQEIKRAHEARVAIQAGIAPDRASHVLRYAANVGLHQALMPYQEVAKAMLPEHYPAEGRTMIDVSLRGSARLDDERDYWDSEATNLTRLYGQKVRERIASGELHHLSVFAIAPQPLLILLGTLIGDITPADVFQRHREPDESWAWPDDGPTMPLVVAQPERTDGPIALKVALSATVDDDRIRAVLGPDTSIWSVTTRNPHNDVLKRPDDLEAFRRTMRGVYDRIKAVHRSGQINLFPVMPVAAAIETGRVWMPKADLQLATWDENRKLGGFRPAITIGVAASGV